MSRATSGFRAFGLALCVLLLTAQSSDTLYDFPASVAPVWVDPATGNGAEFSTPQLACKQQRDNFNSTATLQPATYYTWKAQGCHWTGGSTVLPAIVKLACPKAAGEDFYLYQPGVCLFWKDRHPPKDLDPDCSSCSSAPAPMVGNPIKLDSGEKLRRETDYATADGLLTVNRLYLSGDRSDTVATREVLGFGPHWHGLIPGRLSINLASSYCMQAEYISATGGTHTLYAERFANSDFNYKSVNGSRLRLSYVGTSTPTRTDYFYRPFQAAQPAELKLSYPNGSYILFKLGREDDEVRDLLPVEQVHANGYRKFFDYNGTEETPYRIRDSFGRTLALSWTTPIYGGSTSDRLISAVTLPDGGRLDYGYEAPGAAQDYASVDRLRTVSRTAAGGGVIWSRTYLYEDNRHPHALTGVLDTTGLRVATYGYDQAGMAILTELAGGVDRYQVEHKYGTDKVVRAITNPLGRKETQNYYSKMYPRGIGVARRLTTVQADASGTIPASLSRYDYETDNLYPTNAFVKRYTNGRGYVDEFVNDNGEGRPTSLTKAFGTPDAQTTNVTWHPTLDLPVTEVKPGLTTSYTYTATGQLLTRSELDTTTTLAPYSTNGQRRTWTYAWSPEGRLTSINGPKPVINGVDDVTAFEYDAGGNLTKITNALGHVTRFAGYDPNGNPGTMTDANGTVTAYGYDALGRATSITVQHPFDPTKNATTSVTYDAEGRVTSVTQPASEALYFDYDAAGRLTSVRTANGERVDYTLNAMGGVLSEVTRAGSGVIRNTITRSFDNLNRILTLTLGPGRTRGFQYDALGNMTQAVSGRNLATAYAFDGLDRLTSTLAPDSGTLAEQYDSSDALVAHNDAIGVRTTFVRNGFGEVIGETSPDRGTSVFDHDEAGDIIAEVDGRGQRVDYVRDALGRVLSRTPAGVTGQTATFIYDIAAISGSFGIGRLGKMIDPSGTTLFAYDHRGNMLEKRQAVGTSTAAALSYTYDLADRVVGMAYPSGRLVDYLRDGKGRVIEVKTRGWATAMPVLLATDAAYEPFGPLKSLTYGNTLVMSQDWGTDNRLYAKMVTLPSGTKRWAATYTYDADDNILVIDDGVNAAFNQGFAYDAMDRMTQTTTAFGSTQRYDYTYDINGNRTRVESRASPTSTTAFSVSDYVRTSGTNRLASITTGADVRSITYDARGNTATETRPSSVSIAVTYDAYGQLTSYARTGSPTETNVYNGMGERVRASSSSLTRRFVFDQQGRIVGDYSTSATSVRGEFIWLSPDGEEDNPFGGADGAGGHAPLAVVQGWGTTSSIRWLHGDQLGKPVLTTDTGGSTVSAGSYVTLGYPGQLKTFTDLYYNRYRDYDPTTGRYIQADPIGLEGDANPYSYAKGNSQRWIDPEGRQVAQGAMQGARWGSVFGTPGTVIGAAGGAAFGLCLMSSTCQNSLDRAIKWCMGGPEAPDRCAIAKADANRAYRDLKDKRTPQYTSGGTRGPDVDHYNSILQKQSRLRDAIRRVKLYCRPPPSELVEWERVANMRITPWH